ncbi:hypothetical protein DLM76_10550 [Leptospira yasudae]|uniref:Dit-like phage tail protein N-terminal domain-containing protein n=1 Tax=Leptospira yasudae TaxID=2202201 RepID=A0ABX9M5J6_9LEPT|nr:hypothetical protein [Leptospira yasudae]RHX80670.1 hypothetical protein DLM77_07225 [Leptospira yasudae]RHX94508.1 hypothetical protein DLM76_10550 [Leptospira yasudae]TGK24261.1 hypothetical protein EHQ05_15120 [Leptospira yasudae]TGM00873.1 hypothetical protein EHQ86_20025 [Leptospira yasudae]
MGIVSGRDTIAFTDGDTEVEMNVSMDIQYTYPAEITGHPVEREKGKASITDHVIPGKRGISLRAILSSSVNAFTLSNITVDRKLETLIRWQTEGTFLTMLGYETGGIINRILSMLPASFRFVEPDDPDRRYLGRSIDEIPNLLLGDVSFSEVKETGKDVTVSLSIVPILVAEAKTREIKKVPSGGRKSSAKVEKTGAPKK